MKIAGIILAGGKGRRMSGANKALLHLGGETLVERIAKRLAPQTAILAVNANRDFDAFHLPIAEDGIGGDLGPLDGILGALIFAEKNICSHALTVAADTPFIPYDLAERLISKSFGIIAIPTSNGRLHGTCGLWPVSLSTGLRTFIQSGKSLKLMDYLNETSFVEVPFEGNNPDPFFNINTPEDLAEATRWL